MKRQPIPDELLDGISVADAKEIYKKLIDHYLTQKWLRYRLNTDYGIKVRDSAFSQLLTGQRPIGKKMQLVIYLSHKIIKSYEESLPDYNTPRRKK